MQVIPFRIFNINQFYLPSPMPVFQPLFMRDGILNMFEVEIPNQPVDVLFSGEAFGMELFFMLLDMDVKIRSDTDIKRAVFSRAIM